MRIKRRILSRKYGCVTAAPPSSFFHVLLVLFDRLTILLFEKTIISTDRRIRLKAGQLCDYDGDFFVFVIVDQVSEKILGNSFV